MAGRAPPPFSMKTLLQLVRSSLGRKYLMAATGLLLVGFVFVHMIGNLKVFLGADDLNHYAHMLKYRGWALWGFRIGLLSIALVHVACGLSLAIENRRARPQRYEEHRTMQASFASLCMAASGLLVGAFLLFHLYHFTLKAGPFEVYEKYLSPIAAEPGIFQTLAPVEPGQAYPNVYEMVVKGFSNPWISAFYFAGVGLLCLHLSHGVQSMFQSMGWRSEASGPLLNGLARLVALVIFLGMAAVPAAVLAGIVH